MIVLVTAFIAALVLSPLALVLLDRDLFMRQDGEKRSDGDPADDDAVEALAEVWAGIDGKLDLYKKDTPGSEDGYLDGYLWESREALKRLSRRGYTLVRRDPVSEDRS